MLDGFGTVVNTLGIRMKSCLTDCVYYPGGWVTIRLAVTIKQCGEDQLLSKLVSVLFE